MSGVALAFSDSDLAASAKAYDPERFEAPIVVGHPDLNAPAYGWVKSLTFADGALDAEPHQVDPAFAELVSAGRYKKISAAFFSPDAPNNPSPGVFYLRHVGFLGAVAPAVKGLRSPEFAADEEGVVEFSEWDDVTNASLWRGLRDWLIGKFGQDEADKVVPGYQVGELEQAATQQINQAAAATAPAPMFSDPDQSIKEIASVTPEQATALEAENTQLKNRLAESAAQAKAIRQTAIHAENVAFADVLIAAAKLLPAEQALTVATLDHLAALETPLEYADGDTNKPLIDGFKSFLNGLPKRLELNEVATTTRAAQEASGVEFAAPQGHAVDGQQLVLLGKAKAWQEAHPGTDFLTAVKAVS